MSGPDRRAEAQFALDGPECVARDARLELLATLGARHDRFEVLAHRLYQLGRSGSAEGRQCDARRGLVGTVLGWDAHTQEDEEVPLALADPAADSGQLDRARGAAQVGRGLERADGGPLHGGVDLPPVDPSQGHGLTTRLGVRGQQRIKRAEPADLAGAAEAPGRRAKPADVLRRVAGVRELPVEHASQPASVHEQVPESEVAVHRDVRAGGRAVRLEPAHAELEGGTGLVEGIEEREGVAQRVVRREAGQDGAVDGVDAGQRVPALGGERGAGLGPLGVAQDFARDGLAVEALDDQPGRTEPVVLAVAQRDDRRDGDTSVVRRLEEGALEVDACALGRAGVRRCFAAVPLQDQGEGAVPALAGDGEVERAGDARRPAREAPQPGNTAAEARAEGGGQLVDHDATYSTGTTGLPASSSWCRYSQMP